MKENREHQTFHLGLKAFMQNTDKLLILQDEMGFWELPGGRTEKSETQKALSEILKREVAEELGEQIQYEIGPVFQSWIRKPDLAIDVKQQYQDNDFCIALVGFHCIYKGGDIQLSNEHQNYAWITKDEVEKLEFENTYKEAVQYYFKSLKS